MRPPSPLPPPPFVSHTLPSPAPPPEGEEEQEEGWVGGVGGGRKRGRGVGKRRRRRRGRGKGQPAQSYNRTTVVSCASLPYGGQGLVILLSPWLADRHTCVCVVRDKVGEDESWVGAAERHGSASLIPSFMAFQGLIKSDVS